MLSLQPGRTQIYDRRAEGRVVMKLPSLWSSSNNSDGMCWAKEFWQRQTDFRTSWDSAECCNLPSKHRNRAETTSFQINAHNLDDVGFRIQDSPQFDLLSNETTR